MYRDWHERLATRADAAANDRRRRSSMAARYPRRMMWKFAVLPGTRDRAAARASRSLATRYSPVFRSIATNLPRPRRPSRRATRLLIVARLTAECPMIGRRRSCLRVPVGARASDPLNSPRARRGPAGRGNRWSSGRFPEQLVRTEGTCRSPRPPGGCGRPARRRRARWRCGARASSCSAEGWTRRPSCT